MSHRVDYRFHHYHTALYCRDQLRLIEETSEMGNINALIKQQAYASSAVSASVAFLEAAINSFPLSPLEGNVPIGELPANPRERLAILEDMMQNFSLLNKYQFALATAGLSPFSAGDEPYQSAHILIRLRNALVHFTPEWAHELDAHRKLECQLRGRFSLNPLVDDTHGLFFPRTCLGLGCVEWAITSASNFLQSFYSRLGTPTLMAELEIK